MDISRLHVTQSTVGVGSHLDRLVQSVNRTALDPKQYEGFTVKVGSESGPDGVLGGVLSQQDYDKFMDIVKDVNVMNASYDEMYGVWRKLVDENLLSIYRLGSNFITGSTEYDERGRGINSDAKYNQMEYQRTLLPLYADKDFRNTRASAIDGFKLVAAIANASPKTGETVAKEAFSPQERAPGLQANSDAIADRPMVQLSSLGQLLAKDESAVALTADVNKKDEDADDNEDEISRLSQLLESAKIRRNMDKQAEAAKQSPDTDANTGAQK